MQDEPVKKYLGSIESCFRSLAVGYIERYEEEILTPARANLRIRVRFPKGYILEWNEAIAIQRGHLRHLGYRYHFQNGNNELIFRYDNAPHFLKLKTFPNHKHKPDDVIPENRPKILEVLKEVKTYLML